MQAVGDTVGGAIRERALRYAGERPSLFFGLYAARPRYRDLLVGPRTDLVIEGFPRSGNTFAVFAFRYAQEREVRIAHHLHAPAQVLRAAELGVPALVLVREPLDAVISLMLRDPRFSARRALRYYASFHETVARYEEGFVVGGFEEITHDFGAVIARINARFGTDFALFDHTEENTAEVFARIEASHRARRRDRVAEEQIARPSMARASLKAELKKGLRAPELEALVSRAKAAYEALIPSR